MTSPVAAGFPDFGRTVSQANTLEIADMHVTNVAPFTYPLRYVGDVKALFIFAQPTNVSQRYQLAYFGDSAGTILLDHWGADQEVGATLRQWVPVVGPYVNLTVKRSGAGNAQYTLNLWHIGEPGYFQDDLSGDPVMSQFNVSVAAGASVDFLDPVSGHTPVSWNVTSTAASWQAQALHKDIFGTETVIDFLDNSYTPKGAGRLFYASANSLRYRVTNFDGVAKNFFLFATRDWRV